MMSRIAAELHLVPVYPDAIDSGFTGTNVLLYGAIDKKGDIVVIVRGPTERVIVRRKDRIAGVWVNRDKMEFGGVPAFYAIASNRPIDEIASPALLAFILLTGGVVGAQFGTRAGSLLRGEQLRGLLALIVLAVCGKILIDLFGTPVDLYSLSVAVGL